MSTNGAKPLRGTDLAELKKAIDNISALNKQMTGDDVAAAMATSKSVYGTPPALGGADMPMVGASGTALRSQLNLFPAYLCDLDFANGAWMRVQRGITQKALQEIINTDDMVRFAEVLAGGSGDRPTAKAYSLASAITGLWAAVFEGNSPSSVDEAQARMANLPLLSLTSGDVLAALKLPGIVKKRYPGLAVAVPFMTPYPESLRTRFSAPSKELPFLLSPRSSGAGTGSGNKEIGLQNVLLDLRPLVAFVQAKEGLPNTTDYTWQNAINIAVAYMEYLSHPDPYLGRKHRLFLRFGKQIFGIPPFYCTIDGVEANFIHYSHSGFPLVASLNFEVKEFLGMQW